MSLFGDTALRASPATRYGVAMALSAVCFVARLALHDRLGSHLPFSFFYIAIAGAAVFGGIGPGVVALIFSIFAGEYFFLEASAGNEVVELGRLPVVLSLGHVGIGVFLIAVMDGSRRATRRAAKSADEAAAAHALLRLSMQAASQGSWECDAGCAEFRLSPEALALLGTPERGPFSPGELELLVVPEDRAQLRNALQDLTKTRTLSLDVRRQNAGKVQWLQLRGSAMGASDHERFFGVVTDVTAEKTLVSALRENHNFLEAILAHAGVGIALFDEAGKFVRVNPAFARIFEYPVEEMQGMEVLRIIADEAKAEGEKAKAARLAGDEAPREWPVVTKSGGKRFVRVSGSRLNVQGRKLVLSVALDTTAERELVRAREESEERFRLLADSSPSLIWVTDADGQLLFVNQRYVQFFGRKVEEVRTNGWQPLLHPEDRAAYTGAYEEALRRRTTFRAQARVHDARGQWRWIDSHALPRTGPDGNFLGHVGSSADITDIRTAQTSLERMNAELEGKVAERTARWKEIVEELEAVTYALAHDLRSPLLSMKGYSEILLSTYGSVVDADGKHYLQRIVVAAQRLDSLIQDVLNYNRIVRKELPLARVEVVRLLREIVDSYPRLKSHRDSIALPTDIPPVRANAGALAQALAALLENGVKFVPKDRRPALRITWAAGSDGANVTPMVKLVVEDNGIGIEPTAMPRLFKLFERQHKEYEGTGVGLAIARKAVERMGGRIGAESTPSRGSRFWIELPRAE